MCFFFSAVLIHSLYAGARTHAYTVFDRVSCVFGVALFMFCRISNGTQTATSVQYTQFFVKIKFGFYCSVESTFHSFIHSDKHIYIYICVCIYIVVTYSTVFLNRCLRIVFHIPVHINVCVCA